MIRAITPRLSFAERPSLDRPSVCPRPGPCDVHNTSGIGSRIWLPPCGFRDHRSHHHGGHAGVRAWLLHRVRVFAVRMRLGVVPEEVCERCNNIWSGRSAVMGWAWPTATGSRNLTRKSTPSPFARPGHNHGPGRGLYRPRYRADRHAVCLRHVQPCTKGHGDDLRIPSLHENSFLGCAPTGPAVVSP